MDPAPRMAVDAFGERVGRLLVIDGESYQPSASCPLAYGTELISPFLYPLSSGYCKYSLPVTSSSLSLHITTILSH